MKRLYIIHGWQGYPEEGWFPWLKKEAESKGFKTEVPAMPNTEEPKIEEWVSYLKRLVGKADKDTYFVGHSIGCQAILRYLESTDKRVGGIVFVGGWIHLLPASYEEKEDKEIAKPWLETTINWNKIKNNKFICIFSDNDPYVPVGDSKIFKEKLEAKIIIEHDMGHFSESDGDKIKKLPIVLESLLELSK